MEGQEGNGVEQEVSDVIKAVHVEEVGDVQGGHQQDIGGGIEQQDVQYGEVQQHDGQEHDGQYNDVENVPPPPPPAGMKKTPMQQYVWGFW